MILGQFRLLVVRRPGTWIFSRWNFPDDEGTATAVLLRATMAPITMLFRCMARVLDAVEGKVDQGSTMLTDRFSLWLLQRKH
jgi:hypothetical protein